MQCAHITCHQFSAGKSLMLPACRNTLRVLFLCSGHITVNNVLLQKPAVYIEAPQKNITLVADMESLLLEIRYRVNTLEFREATMKSYPYLLVYDEAPTYKEACKSTKTISRMLVAPRVLPGFSMGSVQTQGTDLIAPHCHGDVDQYFYGLSENNCIAMIDDCRHTFTANELLHIPLGSIHGVLLEEEHTCHYLWIDFLLNEDALFYMDQAHKMEGEPL